MRVHTGGCKQVLRPFVCQLHGQLTAFSAGAGDDHLAYASLKCCFNYPVAVDIERVVSEVTANIDKFHGAHCNSFFSRDAYTCLELPYNPADASEMERFLAIDAV